MAGHKPWSRPPAGNVGILADVRHGATAADAGTTAGMAGQEACSTERHRIKRVGGGFIMA